MTVIFWDLITITVHPTDVQLVNATGQGVATLSTSDWLWKNSTLIILLIASVVIGFLAQRQVNRAQDKTKEAKLKLAKAEQTILDKQNQINDLESDGGILSGTKAQQDVIEWDLRVMTKMKKENKEKDDKISQNEKEIKALQEKLTKSKKDLTQKAEMCLIIHPLYRAFDKYSEFSPNDRLPERGLPYLLALDHIDPNSEWHRSLGVEAVPYALYIMKMGCKYAQPELQDLIKRLFENRKKHKELSDSQKQLSFDFETYNIADQIKSMVISRYNELIKEES